MFELKFGVCFNCGHMHVFGYCHDMLSPDPNIVIACNCDEKWSKDNLRYIEWVDFMRKQNVLSS